MPGFSVQYPAPTAAWQCHTHPEQAHGFAGFDSFFSGVTGSLRWPLSFS
jgi:hypothetical protein